MRTVNSAYTQLRFCSFFKVFIYFKIDVYACGPMCIYVHHIHVGAQRSQKRILEPMELKSQVVVADMWVLGTELWSFPRVVCALYC